MTRPGAYLAGLLRRFRRDQRGAAAIIVAVLMPVFIGGIGLGVETGYWFMWERKLQHIADVSAYSGAVELSNGGSSSDVQNAVANIAASSGYPAGAATPVVVSPYGGNTEAVEVTLTHSLPRLFTGLFATGDVPVSVRAVAAVSTSNTANGCITALSGDEQGAIKFWGNSWITLDSCDLVSNSSHASGIELGGSSDLTITNGCAYAVGGMSGTVNLNAPPECPDLVKLTSPVADPLAHLSPPDTSQCGSVWNGLTVRCYGDLSLDSSNTHSNSIYLISGQMNTRAKKTALVADNVVFVLNGSGHVKFTGNDEVHFTAPTTGPLANVLFFGRQNSNISNDLRGNVSSSFTGTVYFPDSSLDYSGNSWVDCTALIARKITFTGNSWVNCSGGSNADVGGGGGSQSIALIE